MFFLQVHAAFDISWTIIYPLGACLFPCFLLSDTKNRENYIRFPTRFICWGINFRGPCSWSFGGNIPLHQTVTFHRVAALLTKATAHPCLFTRFFGLQKALKGPCVEWWSCMALRLVRTVSQARIWKDYPCMVTLNNWTKSTVESITRFSRCIVFTWQHCKQRQETSRKW